MTLLRDRRFTAFHEACHAAMCLVTGCKIDKVVLYSSPVSGRGGVCEFRRCGRAASDAWVALVAPVADSIKYGFNVTQCLQHHGSEDFEFALLVFEEAFFPPVPTQHKTWAQPGKSDVIASVLELAEDNASQVADRVQTAVRCQEAIDLATRYAHCTVQQIIGYLQQESWFIPFAETLADELARKGSLTGTEVISFALSSSDYHGPMP